MEGRPVSGRFSTDGPVGRNETLRQRHSNRHRLPDCLERWPQDGPRRLSKRRDFEEFTSRIWKTVANQILSDIVDALRAGSKLRFGNAIIGDTAVILKCKKLFGEEDAEFDWSEVTVSSAGDSFIISGPEGSKATSTMAYRDVDNAHFLEDLIRHAFSNGQLTLSNAFS